MTEQPAPATLEDVEPVDAREPSSMDIVLSDGDPRDEAAEAVPLADPIALSREETAAVLARLPDLKAETSDTKDFAKRAESKPPPRTGETVTTPFPPDADRARPAEVDVQDTPLAVLRRQPEGETPIAPHLSVTFNKPMVTIASHADTIAENVPLTISPAVDGQWRWVGSKTLLFEPTAERFPMATEYTVTIPAGTKAATGETLAAPVTWKFGTPPPTVERSYPGNGTHGLEQLMFLSFNQKIDQREVLPHLEVKTGGVFSKAALVLAEPQLIDEDEHIRQLVENAKPGHWIVVRSADALPYDSTITVTAQKGTPSAEGPRTSTTAHSFNFQTYGPFEVVENRCGWRQCSPYDNFSFRFANAIDSELFDPSMVTVEPTFPSMTVNMFGDWIHVNGMKPGRREYTVTLSRELTDEFGQQLEGKNTFSFKVGPSAPQLFSTYGVMSVLDPSAEPSLSVFSVNFSKLAVKAWKVEPTDWPAYLSWTHDYNYYGKHEQTPPGREVLDTTIAVDGEPDDVAETKIDLSALLGESGHGNIIVSIIPTAVTKGSSMPQHPPQIRTWAQSTDIGLDAFVDPTELIAWTSSLDDGEPLGGAEVELLVTSQEAKSDATGLARFDLIQPKKRFEDAANILIARHGGDTAFLPEHMWGYGGSTSWLAQTEPDTLAWFTFDDRQMYRPKESVHIKGWIRALEHHEQGSVRLATGAKTVDWRIFDSRNNELGYGHTETTELGGFSFEFELPDTPNLGPARAELRVLESSAGGSTYEHHFEIQEFRTPEFEVTASAGEGPFFANDTALATVEASYYAGGGLPNAEVHWNVTATPASFTPPNQNEFTFGSWTPWWIAPLGGVDAESHTFQGKTDATGAHYLQLGFGSIEPPRPMSVRAQATVFDVNRQAWTSTATLLVHPSRTYVGIKSDRYFVPRGEPLEIDLVVADVDGKRLAGRPVKARAARLKWVYKNNEYTEEEVDPQTCDLVTDAEGLGECTFKTDVGGTYRISATTVDDYGRAHFSEFTRWVAGGERPVARRVEEEEVILVPDKDEYQPGDTAKILVQSPIVPAEILVTLQREGMIEEKRLTMSEATTTLEIPITTAHFPNLRVQVNAIGSQPRLGEDGKPDDALPRRPAFGRGTINLRIPPTERTLAVNLTPQEDRVEPGARTWVDVVVKDAAGKPVSGAEVAVVVVDEAILALSSYEMADPMEVFYPQRPYDTREFHLRSAVALVDPAALRAANSAPPADGAVGAGGPARPRMMRKSRSAPDEPLPAPILEMMSAESALFNAEAGVGDAPDAPIAVRSDFNPLATFAPAVKTDSSGKARVSYEMPDNLTRYRVMAVAVHGGKYYGTGEDNVTARLPLMARPSPPRFLNFGDHFELPVVLQNQTDEPMQVKVATRGTNVEFASNLGWQVQVPANDRVEVRFPASAAMAGTARFQVAAASGAWADASEFSLPVWTPATSEAFATYGVIDEGSIVQPVATPTEVWPQFGGLDVTTSSTALQALTDAFLYLYNYRYECAEQIASRMVSVAALRDVLTAFEAEGMPSAEEVQASMERDIGELASRQNPDGGFGFWRRGQPSWPYVTIHAAHALARAKQKGYEVDQRVLDRSKNYLAHVERHIPGWWPEWVRLHTIAYALYVRNQMGDKDPAKAREVIKRGGSLEKLSFESVGWLLATMTGQKGYEADTKEIRRFLNNRVTETAAGAHFAAQLADESDYLILRSNRVADGVILEALIENQPKSDLIPKIVNGLLAHRERGRWGNTQENAFILLALDKYFNTFERKTPDFVARIWLGDQYAGDHAFKGRTTERHYVEIPMKYLAAQDGASKLYLQKDGTGRMYYRIGMRYAPKSLYLDPADHGFVVERVYEPVDDDNDVRRRDDGTWEIKAGAKVRVKLTMVAPTRRYHVALVDPLPAGLETLNPALAVTGDIPQDPNANTGRSSTWGWWWWTRPWFEHQNMRDERTEAFASLLWGGVHTYTYYARATTPGMFVVPPAKAHEMYHPETFGRSASDRVAIVD